MEATNTTYSTEQLLGWYEGEGLQLVRVSRATKQPVDENWQNLKIPLDKAVAWVNRGGNIGIQAGEVSNWICCVDMDCPEAVQLAPEFLPETLKIHKGSQAPSVYVYRVPGLGFRKYKDLEGSTLIDLKASNDGAGHMFVVEPSMHPDKGLYEWTGGFNPAAIAEVSEEELQVAVALLAVATLVARHLPDTGRHDLAMALAGYLLRNGVSVEDALKILLAAWRIKGAPRKAFRDIEGIVRDTKVRLDRNEPATGGRTLEETISGMPSRIAKFLGWQRTDNREQRRHYMRTDLGNAERFVDQHRGCVLWCPARKLFLVWDGKRWIWDESGEAVKLAHETARSIFHEAAFTEDKDEQKKIAGFAAISQSSARIRAMLLEAKPYLAVGVDELDQDPWAINCQNGTLDLRTGKLSAHNPADLITRIVPLNYEPGAECPRFKQFLKEVLIDDAVIDFVRRYSGYTLTGDTRERIFAILYGFGKNGKTTLVELFEDLLGDYAQGTDTETILMKKYSGVGNDVAALQGARFVFCSEVEHGRRLAESKVKQLTGRDTVTARFLFGEHFSFRPAFKLWLSTNNKPEIQGTDDAIWDRVRLIPFTQRFEGNQADATLPEKLREEMPGIFAWMVAGCLEWQEHGIGEPERILTATKEYRSEMDTFASFFEDCCVLRKDLMTPSTTLFGEYKDWAWKAGEKEETKKSFGMRLKERGFENKKITSGRHKDRMGWLGIGLRAEHPDPDDPNAAKDATFGATTDADSAEDASPGGTGAEDPPPDETSGFAGKTSGSTVEAEDSGTKNQKVGAENTSRKEGFGKSSASSATSANGHEENLEAFLRDPPEWLSTQLELCRNDPDRFINPTCSAVAQDVYGTATRWQEVKSVLARWLAEGRNA